MEKVIRASLDRIEGDFAVVYSDDDDDHHNKFDVPLELVKDAKPGKRRPSEQEIEFTRNTKGCDKVAI
jgi:hypothetical protein